MTKSLNDIYDDLKQKNQKFLEEATETCAKRIKEWVDKNPGRDLDREVAEEAAHEIVEAYPIDILALALTHHNIFTTDPDAICDEVDYYIAEQGTIAYNVLVAKERANNKKTGEEK